MPKTLYRHEAEDGRQFTVILTDTDPAELIIRCDAPGLMAVSHTLSLEDWDTLGLRIEDVLNEPPSQEPA